MANQQLAHPRVLMISPSWPPRQCGIADYTAELCRYLTAAGADIEVLTSYPDGHIQPALSTAGMAPVTADQALSEMKPSPTALHASIRRWNFGIWSPISAWLQQLHADILHIQYQIGLYDMHPAITLLPWRLRQLKSPVKIVTTFHDFRVPYLWPKAGKIRELPASLLARYSHQVIVTNEEDLQRGKGNAKYQLIRLGNNIQPVPLKPGIRQAWRDRWQIGNGVALGYTGFLNESKGVDLLLLALKEVISYNTPVKLIMLGGGIGQTDPTNISYEQRLQALIRQQGLLEQIVWTGYLDSAALSEAMQSVDVCVLPFRDGISFRRTSLIAALAHGLPVISTEPQVEIPSLQRSNNVLLVPANDVPALAEAMRQLSGSVFLRRTLSAGAKELAKTFAWETVTAATLQLYRGM